MISITLIHNGIPIVHQPFRNNQIRIGSGFDNDLVLASDLVAERQLVISRDDSGRWFSSHSSSAASSSRLCPGTRIAFGDVELELSEGAAQDMQNENQIPSSPALRATRKQGLRARATGIVGTSTAVARMRLRIEKLAPLREPVLIQGETGTGKELAARAVHMLSPFREGPFIPLNCGALTETMVEDVLFGHERGSFTGAGTTHRGVFEQADGGTLFLDEIGELPLSQQASLLRVLDGGSVSRIGSEKCCQVTFRLVAATNRDLAQMVENREFRLDLFHRISTLTVTTPPLRERGEDMLTLSSLFLSKMDAGPRQVLTTQAEEKILRYKWPGNIRELRNVLFRAWALGTEERIDERDLEIEVADAELPSRKLPRVLLTGEVVAAAMSATEGNISAAARELAVPRSTLRNWLRHDAIRSSPAVRDCETLSINTHIA